jgi:tetratricopeptide (TPR) repeat protein
VKGNSQHRFGSLGSRALARLLGGLCLLLGGALAAAELSENERNDLYSEAKRLFREANAAAETQPEAARDLFAKAVLRFERLATAGSIHNGKLYYNIGNCYFRMEDLGRAILNYRRAEQYTPNDPNLRQNLDYARRRRLDRLEVPERTKVLKTILFFHYDLAQRTRARGFGAAFTLFWLFLAGRLWLRSGVLNGLAAVAGLVAVLLLGSLVAEWWHWHAVRPGVVVAAEVIARKGDGASFEPAFTAPLHAGTEFRLLEDRGDWLAVTLDDGRTCWLPAKDVERVR